MPVFCRAKRAERALLAILLGLPLAASSARADSNHGFGNWSPSCAPTCTSEDLFSSGNNAAATEADKAQGESQKLAGDARDQAELANHLRADRAGLQRQLSQIPPSQNSVAERNAILSRTYELPEKFKSAGRSFQLKTLRDLDTRGEKIQKQLMERAVETRSQAEALNEKAREGYTAARKLSGLESTSHQRVQGMKSASAFGAVKSTARSAQPDKLAGSSEGSGVKSKNNSRNPSVDSSSLKADFAIPEMPWGQSSKIDSSRKPASLGFSAQQSPEEAKNLLTTQKFMSKFDELLLKATGASDARGHDMAPEGAGNAGSVAEALLGTDPPLSASSNPTFRAGDGAAFDLAEISASELSLFQIMSRRIRTYHKLLSGD